MSIAKHIFQNPANVKIVELQSATRNKKREYELLERGLDPVTSFGERVALDFIVVGKTAESKTDHYVLMIRDEWSGFREYPCFQEMVT